MKRIGKETQRDLTIRIPRALNQKTSMKNNCWRLKIPKKLK